MKRTATALVSCGLLGFAGCGNLETGGGVSTVEDNLSAPALWRCSAYCSKPGSDNDKDDLRKRKWRDCSATAKLAAQDAGAWCAKTKKGSGYVDKAHGAKRDAECVSIKSKKHPKKCQLSYGGGWGDPHMYTFDGLAYEFQPLGEFVFATDNQTYKIQMRTERYGGSLASLQTAIAVQLEDGTTIAVQPTQTQTFLVNGAPANFDCADGTLIPNGKLCSGSLELDNGGWVEYDATSQNFSINFPDEVSHLEVQVAWAGQPYLNTQFYLGPAIETTTVGALGNNNGNAADDIVTRDGKLLTQPVSFGDLYATYATSWRISDNESLFAYEVGKSTASYSDTSFPASPFTSANLPTGTQANAKAACAKGGVAFDQLEACALDVALLGNGAIQAFLKTNAF